MRYLTCTLQICCFSLLISFAAIASAHKTNNTNTESSNTSHSAKQNNHYNKLPNSNKSTHSTTHKNNHSSIKRSITQRPNKAKDKTKLEPLVIVKINGLKDPALQNVKNRLNTLIQPMHRNSDPAKVRFFYRQAYSQIQSSIQPFGYFKATITSSLQYQDDHWLATFNITPGPVMQLTRIKLRIDGPGSNLKAFQRYKKHLPIKINTPLDVEKYNKSKQLFLDSANRLGFFQAKIVKSQLRINLKSYQAYIILHFSTGTRYHFGLTQFNPSPYNESFLRRYMNYHHDQHYNSHRIQSTQLDLSNSPYFSQVIVNPHPNQQPPPFNVPIKIKTTAAASQRYTLGGGYGTDTGARMVGSAEWLRVTRSGQRLKLSGSYAQHNNYFLANYIIPGRKPAINYYTLSGGIYHLDLSHVGSADSHKLGISYDTTIKGWQQTLALTYLREKYQFNRQNDRNLSPLLTNKQQANMVIPSITWTRRKVRGRSIPRAGYLINLELSGAHHHLLASDSFFQAKLSTKFLYTLPYGLRTILRGQLGYTKINDINHLPLSLQLLAGGANSLRGYGFQSIGPGRKLYLASIELQKKLIGNLYLVGFYDSGNVSDNWVSVLKQSAGPGLAYLTSIGTFELTAAKPLRDPTLKWRIQFSMAPTL